MGYQNLVRMFRDDRIHVAAGRVVHPAGEAAHFYVNEERQVVVHVELHQHGTPVRANLSNHPGVWTVPDVDTEVLVGSDNGDFEGELYIVGTFPITNRQHAEVPASLGSQVFNVVVTGDANIVVGPGSTIRLLSDTRIELATPNGSVSGAPEAVAFQTELHAIWAYLDRQFSVGTGHTHISAGPGTFPSGPPVESSGIGGASTAPEPIGSDVVRVE